MTLDPDHIGFFDKPIGRDRSFSTTFPRGIGVSLCICLSALVEERGQDRRLSKVVVERLLNVLFQFGPIALSV